MANLSQIKKRIKSVNDTKKITNAMYLVSSAKLNSGTVQLLKSNKYYSVLKSQVDSSAPFSSRTEYTEKKEGPKLTFIFGSEKGFSGEYSKLLYKKYLEQNVKSEDVIFVLGGNTRKLFEAKGLKVLSSSETFKKSTEYKNAYDICCFLCSKYLNNEVSEIDIIYIPYTKTDSKAEAFKMLPLESDESESDISYYPNKESVSKLIQKKYIENKIYNILLNSYCSEQKSIMTTMDSSNTNAGKLLDELNLKYNRLRQNAITSEIAEISTGIKRGNGQ